MQPRLALVSFKDSAELQQRVIDELTKLSERPPEFWSPKHISLDACCKYAAKLVAEFNAYYSRQFAHVGRHCVRFHFFSEPAPKRRGVLDYLDRRKVPASYL